MDLDDESRKIGLDYGWIMMWFWMYGVMGCNVKCRNNHEYMWILWNWDLISLWLTLKTIGFNQNGFKFVIDSNVRMNFK